MKTLINIIFIIVLAAQIEAQNQNWTTYKVIDYSGIKRNFKLNKSIHLFESIDFLMIPQFGGLFNESFKYVEGITDLKNYYDDFDLGLKLGFNYKIMDKMTFTSVYNIGMLKFNLTEASNIEGAIMKVVFCYNF